MIPRFPASISGHFGPGPKWKSLLYLDVLLTALDPRRPVVLRHYAYRQVFALLLKETTLKHPDMGTRSEWKINSGWVDITIQYLGGGPSNNSRVIRVLSFQTDLHQVAEWRNMLPSWKNDIQQFMPLLSAPTQSWCTSRRKLVSCDRRWSNELVAKWTCFCKLEPPSVGQLFGY